MAATGLNKYVKAAVEQRIRWREACKVTKPSEWCRCVPLLSRPSLNSLLGYAPPGAEVEIPERSPEDLALFCGTCGRPRNPLYVDGVWPAGMLERLIGNQLEEEIEVEEIDDEKEQRAAVSPFPTNGNGHHVVREPPARRVNDDDKGDGNDWAL